MKIVVFGPQHRVGVLDGARVIDLNAAYAKFTRETQDEPIPYAMANAMTPSNLHEFILAGPRALESAQKALEYAAKSDGRGLEGVALAVDVAQTKLHAPIAHRGIRMMMAAGNYADHMVGIATNRRHRTDVKAEVLVQNNRNRGPRGFWKIAQHVVATEDDVTPPARTQLFDYEAEVSIVLGKTVRDMASGRLRDYVWGITLVNDLSCRDPQNDGLDDLALSIAKNFDASAPVGPCIVVGEGLDPQNISFQTHVNGEQRQNGNSKDMIFSFDEYLAYASRDMTFQPGDMLCAGTSGGTANDSSQWDEKGEKPLDNKFLKVGDLIEISSPVIGMLRNRVVAKK